MKPAESGVVGPLRANGGGRRRGATATPRRCLRDGVALGVEALLFLVAVGPPLAAQSAEGDLGPTQTIFEDILIEKNQPALSLKNTSFGGVTYSARVSGGTFGLTREGDSTYALVLYDASGTPMLGVSREVSFQRGLLIGQALSTLVPLYPLHVGAIGPNPAVVVENVTGQTIGRNLLRLVNNGPATFRFENAAAVAGGQSGAIWSFGQRALGNQFFISTAGAPGLNLTMDPGGNMTIAGSLSQMSDRASKQAIVPVDGEAVLERVAALPVSTWSYKGDAARHIGPMAQDFSAAFGFGPDDRHVAPSDVAGVSLAAVQALGRRLSERQDEVDRLARELERQRTEVHEELGRLRHDLERLAPPRGSRPSS